MWVRPGPCVQRASDRDNRMQPYDMNVTPGRSSEAKVAVFGGSSVWHCDCSVTDRLLKTLAALFPACPASARRWVVLKSKKSSLAYLR